MWSFLRSDCQSPITEGSYSAVTAAYLSLVDLEHSPVTLSSSYGPAYEDGSYYVKVFAKDSLFRPSKPHDAVCRLRRIWIAGFVMYTMTTTASTQISAGVADAPKTGYVYEQSQRPL